MSWLKVPPTVILCPFNVQRPYGFSPCIGRRFEAIVPQMTEALASASNYGIATQAERFQLFVRLGTLIKEGIGYGFRVRDTVGDKLILTQWDSVMAWWLQVPGVAHPDPKLLRAWQRFVGDNLEFRLGTNIGAVVSELWTRGAGDALTPDLATWKDSTGLPWFAFWAKE